MAKNKCFYVSCSDDEDWIVGYFMAQTAGAARWKAYKSEPGAFDNFGEFMEHCRVRRCPTLDMLRSDITCNNIDEYEAMLRVKGLCTGYAGDEKYADNRQYHRVPKLN